MCKEIMNKYYLWIKALYDDMDDLTQDPALATDDDVAQSHKDTMDQLQLHKLMVKKKLLKLK